MKVQTLKQQIDEAGRGAKKDNGYSYIIKTGSSKK
jgi:hypothetical protein